MKIRGVMNIVGLEAQKAIIWHQSRVAQDHLEKMGIPDAKEEIKWLVANDLVAPALLHFIANEAKMDLLKELTE